MKTFRSIILALAAMLCMQISVTYASINYIADADLASKNINNIMTMYLGMPEKDFLHNFSDVQEWKLSERHSGRDKDWYCYYLTKGDGLDIVSEQIFVEICDDVVSCVQWNFYTSKKAAQKVVYGKIQGNIMKQIGNPYVDKTKRSIWGFGNTKVYLLNIENGVRLSVGIPLAD